MQITGVVSRLIACLNPYIACRKDAVGVSDVIMKSSIVTGSEIGTLVTARPLKQREREPCDFISLGVITSAPTAHMKTLVTASLG